MAGRDRQHLGGRDVEVAEVPSTIDEHSSGDRDVQCLQRCALRVEELERRATVERAEPDEDAAVAGVRHGTDVLDRRIEPLQAGVVDQRDAVTVGDQE